jgi:hypothetical protein
LTHGFKAEKNGQPIPDVSGDPRSIEPPWICEFGNEEIEMRDSQSSNGAKAPGAPSHPEVMACELPATGNDAGLLTLEVQFDSVVTELLAARKASDEVFICPDQRSLVQDSLQAGVDVESDHETRTKHEEAILARLYPIEQAIMRTHAHTIAGLGVKARHAAYVMSQHWEVPIDRIDWDAQAARLLVEAVCDLAPRPLPFQHTRGDE